MHTPPVSEAFSRSSHSVPIAVVSMGVRAPSALSGQAYWQLILDRRAAVSVPPPGRWPTHREHLIDEQGGPDRAFHDRACFLSPLESDPPDLPLTVEQLDALDPLCRVVLHAGHEAWHSMKSHGLSPERCGVILANIALPTEASARLTQDILAPLLLDRMLTQRGVHHDNKFLENIYFKEHRSHFLNQYIMSLPAAVLSYALGLQGGSYTLDAACASSLYAIALAMQELQAGTLDAVLTGGASMAQSLFTQIGFTQLQALSRSGACRPFDTRADGLLVGEGAVLFVLKRLPDAIAAQDEILGIIRGVGLSNDLAGSLLSPAMEGQLRAMKQAYHQAGWDPCSVQLIECHGTGTPRGDTVELQSLSTLWAEARSEQNAQASAVLGSVKANVGHLLTGAGAAGLARVLLALKHRTLPPQAHADAQHSHPLLAQGPFRVLESPEPWPTLSPDQPRRAAVSAFGFGGINAHLLLEEYVHGRTGPAAPEHPLTTPSPSATPIAIVGMGAHMGSLTSLPLLKQALFETGNAFSSVPEHRWEGITHEALQKLGLALPSRGAWIAQLDIPAGQFKIPPGELASILPQHLLMLDAASAAARDVASLEETPPARRGIVVGLELDLETTHHAFRWKLPDTLSRHSREGQRPLSPEECLELAEQLAPGMSPPLDSSRTLGSLGGMIASRIAREIRAGGPSFGVSCQDGSGLRAVSVGIQLLHSGQADVVVAGGVHLGGHLAQLVASTPTHAWSDRAPIPFDALSEGSLPAEGAGALVLKRLEDAQSAGDRIYAIIDGCGAARGGPPGVLAGTTPIAQALRRVSKSSSTCRLPGLIVGHGGISSTQIHEELKGLAEALGPAEHKTTALMSCRHLVGEGGAGAGIASLIAASLCLYHRALPSIEAFQSFPQSDLWTSSPLHVATSTQHWLRNRREGSRRALVLSRSHDGNAIALALREAAVDSIPAGNRPPQTGTVATGRTGTDPRLYLKRSSAPGLFLVRGDTRERLRLELRALKSHVEALRRKQETLQHPLEQTQRLAQSWAHLPKEFAFGDTALWCRAIVARDPVSLDDQLHRLDHELSQLTPEADPRRLEGELAFVFPGSGNHFPGLGLELSAAFPQVLIEQDRETESLLDQLMPWQHFPWRSCWKTGWEREAGRILDQDSMAQIFGQVSYGVFMSDVLRLFGLCPDAMIGYSLGETASLFASRTWTARDVMFQRADASGLFRAALSGEYQLARAHWSRGFEHASAENGWYAAVLNRDATRVRSGLTLNTWLLIVNAPNECVVGGRRAEVLELIQRLQCQAVPLEGIPSVHCPLVEPVAHDYKHLHLLPVQTPLMGRTAPIRIYSCAFGRSYPPDSEQAARSILENARHGFDFPTVIEQAWKDGVRIFVEPGPQSSCTRMIRRILGDRPFRAVGVCSRAYSGLNTLIHGLARLAEAGLPVDLQALYPQPPEQATQRPPSQTASTPEGVVHTLRPGLRVALSLNPHPPHRQDHATARRPESSSSGSAGQPSAAPTLESSQGHVEPTPSAPDPSLTLPLEDPRPMLFELHRQTQALLNQMQINIEHSAVLHSHFLEQNFSLSQQQQQLLEHQQRLWSAALLSPPAAVELHDLSHSLLAPNYLDREACLRFATDKLSHVFGADWTDVDAFPTRVRLPDEPLMLVDRVLTTEGTFGTPGPGRVVTEHDVLPDAWYLDGGRAPVCISVEAGQADLYLSGWLGIDRLTRGERVYRLLDARVTFHRELPRPGETIRYDIHIDRFICQAGTWMFFFWFDGTIQGEKVITMREGCAGFFSPSQLEQGRGISALPEPRPLPRRRLPSGEPAAPYRPLVPLDKLQPSLPEAGLDALRKGYLEEAFGTDFAGLFLPPALHLPGGRMKLVDRILKLEVNGGRYGLGQIIGEADITPDAWFLTCHFVDDPVMPGTLMYECCLHTLRVLLLRLGWIVASEETYLAPIPEVSSKLKCRGQVLPSTSKVQYRIEIREIGYAPMPYVIADALMYADGHPIVWMEEMSAQLPGVTEQTLTALWSARAPTAADILPEASGTISAERYHGYDRILAFAVGNPSEAFGPPYLPFDAERRIARLPGPPYCFISRIVDCGQQPWHLERGSFAVAEYDVPPNAWYFQANRSALMPFAVLLEIALQPCGWLAAWMGSALRSPLDLHFRNLEGEATLLMDVGPGTGTLRIEVQLTEFSEAGGMILQRYELKVDASEGPVYRGWTRFGFFPTQALLQQVGIRGAEARQWRANLPGDAWTLPDLLPHTPEEASTLTSKALPHGFPGRAFRMLDQIVSWLPAGGAAGLGHIVGEKAVDPNEWFFSAHFYQDPVIPGSLGLEAFLQLLKVVALKRWGDDALTTWEVEPIAKDRLHRWWYRGQIIPSHARVRVEASVSQIQEDAQERLLVADGFVSVDGRIIYELREFALRFRRPVG